MPQLTRRHFLQASAAAAAIPRAAAAADTLPEAGERPRQAAGVRVINPRARVPVSFIIDDSTALVNVAHFCIPQFAEVFPTQYRQDWRKLPRSIPDDFVRKFIDYCGEHGVRGKYSMVPYPSLVGWLDRDLPGWSKQELRDSLKLVRERVTPAWDIHPEMITHTWAIDLKTGRPFADRTERSMENWGFSVGKSADELAAYLGHALRILKNVDLPCEGVTTPGGFGTKSRPALARGTLEAVRDVYGAEIPHYFRDVITDARSVVPQVHYASGLSGSAPKCAVHIVGCTGDWFGGWDGLTPGSADQFITADLKGGRLPQVIAREEPAILVCHWPGIYYNGEEHGFRVFKTVRERLHAAYDNLLWMKNSEIARYWAARELTAIDRAGSTVTFKAPFAAPAFTVQIPAQTGVPRLVLGGKPRPLREVKSPLKLEAGTWTRRGSDVLACWDLPKGTCAIEIGPGAA